MGKFMLLQEKMHESCTLYPKLCNFHAIWDNLASQKAGRMQRQYSRAPKMAVPTRTILLPQRRAMG